MKNNKYSQYQKFALNALTASILLASTSLYALQEMNESDLRAVNGQNGVQLSASLSEANIDQVYWTDDAGRGTAGATNSRLKAIGENVKIRNSNASNLPLSADLTLNAGSRDNQAGLNVDVNLSPLLMSVDAFKVCDTEATAKCSPTLGSLAIQTSSNTNVSLKTPNGIFSPDQLGELTLGLKNAHIYLGQTDANLQLNQLILKNFNFNFQAKGAMFVDESGGLRLQTNARTGGVDRIASLTDTPNESLGYADLTRVLDPGSKKTGFNNTGTYGNGKSGAEGETTTSGLNIEFMLSKNVDKTNPYNIDTTTNSASDAKGLLRLGASGRLVNSSITVRGVTGNDALLGKATNSSGSSADHVVGNSGIAARMKTDFTKDNDSMLAGGGQATTLEIGGAGLGVYGFEFSNLTGLRPNTRASFDSGDVYLNLVDSQTLSLPTNLVFQKSRFGNGSFLTLNADYIQQIQNAALGAQNPYSIVAAIRGAEFQAISRRGRFTTSGGHIDQSYLFKDNGLNNEWGLALPFYNLNANMALFGTKVRADQAFYYTLAGSKIIKNTVGTTGETSRLGFSLAMSTEGVDKDSSGKALGNKTTSILVIDGGKVGSTDSATDYYMGLRNIDMLLKGDGNIGIENGSINIGLRNMLIVMSAEVAAGYLPGTTYKTCMLNASAMGCGGGGSSPLNNFALADDVLFGAKLRLGGDIDFSLIPNNDLANGGALTIVGDLKLKGSGNTVQISDPQDGSTFGLDNLTGDIAFHNDIVIKKDMSTQLGNVGFNYSLQFNPNKTAEGVFRARDINFYPPNTGPGARLGELAITGGRLTSEFSITPRN
ncbi:DUF6160 family protein [Acinetobacter shaoyimingii]|uniref:Heme utilization protein n=1 Tax=Acinetobacter shaoyimingii TaxID=2715164 RepID=A0A6G8RXL1_9GAMM|nr:DUF6160 family protein [Acinetobacter shaoyimingii]QIO06682.1 heme utilization protein [Acinetobacter shaoyimingii]